MMKMIIRMFKKVNYVFMLAVLLANPVNANVYPVSLIELLAVPEKFNGKEISVIGYLNGTITFDLYLSRDHANILDRESSIEIIDNTPDGSLIQSSCASNYVQVKGTFKKRADSMYVIAYIKSVSIMESLKTCWKSSE